MNKNDQPVCMRKVSGLRTYCRHKESSHYKDGPCKFCKCVGFVLPEEKPRWS